jgi:hypothetical protein
MGDVVRNSNFNNVYTKDFAYLVGVILGDGCLYVGKSSYQLSVTSEDYDFCKNCSDIINNLFDKRGSIKEVKKNGKISYYQLVVCSKDIVFFLKDLTKNKTKIPLFIYKNNKFKKHFVQGLMDSDGWISEINASDGFKRYRVGFKNTSGWTKDFKDILRDLKVKTGKIREVGNSRSYKSAYTFTINTFDYCSKIGFRINRKNNVKDRFIDFHNNKKNKSKKTDNVILRVNEKEHSIIKNKSSFFGMKKSEFLRHCVFSYWSNQNDIDSFKAMLIKYSEGDKKTKDEVVEILFQYYRNNGFPHQFLTDAQKINRIDRVIKSKNILLENNLLQLNSQGVDLANHYHPHMMEAYYKNTRESSPIQTFQDDDRLKDCISRWLELGKIPNPSGMRRILKTRDGTRGVVNFKPVIAKFIYDNYIPYGGSVLDPCSGYSGRLVGCIASNRNLFYHGIDPNGKTAVGNMELASFFSCQRDALGDRIYKYNFRFDLGCAEEVMPKIKEKYDLIFTSPPYFNTEIYSTSENQSSHKYDEYEEWLNKFLFVIIDESRRILKDEGTLVINVKNYRNRSIADDLCSYCEKDFRLVNTYYMKMANNSYNRKTGDSFHTEPLFIWNKK